jgi:hypothetical protein
MRIGCAPVVVVYSILLAQMTNESYVMLDVAVRCTLVFRMRDTYDQQVA